MHASRRHIERHGQDVTVITRTVTTSTNAEGWDEEEVTEERYDTKAVVSTPNAATMVRGEAGTTANVDMVMYLRDDLGFGIGSFEGEGQPPSVIEYRGEEWDVQNAVAVGSGALFVEVSR